MSMKIDPAIIVENRNTKAWSQQHLADVSGLSLRTVQRMENAGVGSPDSIKAIAQAFSLVPADLMQKTYANPPANTGLKKRTTYITIALTALIGMGASVWLSARPSEKVSIEHAVDKSVTTEPESIAIRYATEWLELVDQKRFQESWENTAPIFQQNVTPQQWEAADTRAKKGFGTLVERSISSIQLSTSFQGLPDGNYATVVFASKYENKESAIETLFMSNLHGEWRTIGYFVR